MGILRRGVGSIPCPVRVSSGAPAIGVSVGQSLEVGLRGAWRAPKRASVFLGHFLMIVGDVRNTGGQLRDYPTSPSPYKQYPGLYFPPTSIEDRNPLKNYDFIIGA